MSSDLRLYAVGDVYALAGQASRRGRRTQLLKVYVSSTPGDSELERKCLQERVVPALQAQLGVEGVQRSSCGPVVEVQLIDLRLSCTRDEMDTVHAALE